MIYTSKLPNDLDMIQALGSIAIPFPITTWDACFAGIGENDKKLLIAVERKKIGDMVACILNNRYLNQLQSSHEAGADVLVLIVECGEIRSNPEDGLLDMRYWAINPLTRKHKQSWVPVKPGITYSRFDQYLTELTYLAGVIVKRSFDVRETAAIILALYNNFQLPPDKHGSLHGIYKAPLSTALLRKPSLIRRIASELPDIGWTRSGDVAKHFQSISDMISADVKEWQGIAGVGKKTAQKVVQEINRKKAP